VWVSTAKAERITIVPRIGGPAALAAEAPGPSSQHYATVKMTAALPAE
jgi:hypothetical protein